MVFSNKDCDGVTDIQADPLQFFFKWALLVFWFESMWFMLQTPKYITIFGRRKTLIFCELSANAFSNKYCELMILTSQLLEKHKFFDEIGIFIGIFMFSAKIGREIISQNWLLYDCFFTYMLQLPHSAIFLLQLP